MATTLRDIGFKLGYDLDKQSEAQVENSIKTLKSMATKMLGAIGIGFSLTQVNALAEEFNGINDKINYAVKGLADQEKTQKKILKAANDTKTSYSGMANMVSQLVQVNSNLFPLDDAVEFASLTQKLLITAGKSESEATALQSTITKVFQTGEVSSAILKRLHTQAPEVLNTVAKKLGMTTDQLYELADAGKVTGETLKSVIIGAADEINSDFDNLDYSISDALLNVRNSWGYFIDDMNSTLGVTQTIAKAITRLSNVAINVANKIKTRIEWIAEKLGGTEKLLKLITIIAGAVFLALNSEKILLFLKGVGKAISNIHLETLAIIAVIVILALLVEDFIAFMRGEDSLIGTLLEQAGVDCDAFREKIKAVWNGIKDFLKKVWEIIKNVVVTVWGGIQDFIAEHGEQIRAMFQAIWNAIKTIFITAFNAVKTIVQSVFGSLQTFWENWGDKIKAVFQQLVDFAKRHFERLISIVQGVAEFFSAIFSGDIKGALEALKGVFQNILNDIIDSVKTIFTAIWTLVGDKVIAIKDAIVQGFQSAVDWIKSLPSQALQWGKDIIQGIIDGITGMIGKVADTVKGVAGKIKSFLGFSEPEDGPLSDFHTYMPDMMDLMAEGIDDNRDKVLKSLGDVTSDMSILARSDVVSPVTAQSVGNSFSSSRTITQNVEINNEFNGDRAGQEKSSAAMRSASDDAVGQMARALAFAK